MFSNKELPSASSIFSAYASVAGSMMLVRSMAQDLIPQPIRNYVFSTLQCFFKSPSSTLTLVIDDSNAMSNNQIYSASETYLCTKLSPNTRRLKISKSPKEKDVSIQLDNGEKIVEFYQGVELIWNFVSEEGDKNEQRGVEKQFFELSFHKKHKDLIFNSYLPYLIKRAQEIEDEKRILKMYTLNCLRWECINLEHPATFRTVAMDTQLKTSVIEDLNRFIKRREFYKRVGRAWKRGYLLYGPPGTGKSSLVAAMANHLKFDVYDLQLANIKRDADLRRLLLATGNRSILVIEDIDCSVDLPNRSQGGDAHKQGDLQLTLSGLLNFIDGLWSSCGDERIIIFTTNHKERLDPALLRPGRMDMHIHMSYCTFQGFKTLASNYLDLPSDTHHNLYGEIQDMIDTAEVTPAQIAEELMNSEDADVALGGVVKLLKRKNLEGDELENNSDGTRDESPDKKRRNLGVVRKKSSGSGGSRRKSLRRRN